VSGTNVRTAHAQAFKCICDYVSEKIIGECRVERMTMINNRYLQEIKASYPAVYNDGYPNHALKSKLLIHFGEKLTFWLPQHRCKSELVFSSDLDVGEAVEAAFGALSSESAILKKAADILRKDIQCVFSASSESPWPPSCEYLETVLPPQSVTRFVGLVIGGKETQNSSERVVRVTKSIAEDMCYAVTLDKWQMHKHVCLGMSMMHLTGSADIVTILNRYGHCLSYSKIMEFETALAEQVKLVKDFFHQMFRQSAMCAVMCVGTILIYGKRLHQARALPTRATGLSFRKCPMAVICQVSYHQLHALANAV